MKKTLGVGALILALLVPLVSFAAEFRVGEQPSLRADERITNDLYLAGGSITSAGSVTGDLLMGGGNVVVSGSIGADLFVGGGNVTILSNIADDLRVAGGNVVIEGSIGGDALIAGGQITLGGPGVKGDSAIVGGNVRIEAPIAGSLRIAGGNVYIDSPISGEIFIDAEKITFGSKARITGDLSYTSSKEFIKEDGAVIQGKVDFKQRAERNLPMAPFAALFSIWVIAKFLMLLISSLVIGLLFKRYSKELVTKALEQPVKEIGRGLLVIVAMPALSMLLLSTIIGIPFGIIGLLGFVIILILACIVTPIIFGSIAHHYIFKSEWEISWKTILLGSFLYSILCIIPFLGWVIQMLFMLLSLGTMVAIKLDVIQSWR